MGDMHRIPRCKDKKHSDTDFEYLLKVDPNKLSHNLSSFFTRPVYAYTKASVGGHEHETSNV